MLVNKWLTMILIVIALALITHNSKNLLMETVLQKLLTLDQNMVMVILITIFYTLEQLIKTPHKFNKRGFHLLNNIPFQVMFMVIFYFVALVPGVEYSKVK